MPGCCQVGPPLLTDRQRAPPAAPWYRQRGAGRRGLRDRREDGDTQATRGDQPDRAAPGDAPSRLECSAGTTPCGCGPSRSGAPKATVWCTRRPSRRPAGQLPTQGDRRPTGSQSSRLVLRFVARVRPVAWAERRGTGRSVLRTTRAAGSAQGDWARADRAWAAELAATTSSTSTAPSPRSRAPASRSGRRRAPPTPTPSRARPRCRRTAPARPSRL